METSIVLPFINASVNLLDQMFGLVANPSKSFELDKLLGHRWDISGVLGVTGDARGIIVVRLHHEFVDKLLEKSGVLVEDAEERREVINGMVGELVNVIAGNAIGNIEGKNLDISPPMVIQGEDHRISWPRIAPVVCIPFHTDLGDFELAVCIEEIS